MSKDAVPESIPDTFWCLRPVGGRKLIREMAHVATNLHRHGSGSQSHERSAMPSAATASNVLSEKHFAAVAATFHRVGTWFGSPSGVRQKSFFQTYYRVCTL